MSTRFRTRLPAGRWECPGPGSASTKTAGRPRGKPGGRCWLQRSLPAVPRPPGHLRVAAGLREAGWQVSENTVAALMREQGLAAWRKKKRRSATRPSKGRWRAPDLVKRDFPADKLNTTWYGDGAEIKTGQGKIYLASVMDMASRRVLGFAAGEHHDAPLAYSALVMAVATVGRRQPGLPRKGGPTPSASTRKPSSGITWLTCSRGVGTPLCCHWP